MWRGRRVSIVIPCYNEEEGLRRLLPGLPRWADEVIVVDNASTDGTASVARAAGAAVVYEPRRGYGRAYKTGFLHATGDIIVALDGDATYAPYAVEYLVNVLIDDELSFASARRVTTDACASLSTLARFLGGKLFNLCALLTDGVVFRDVLSGMWAFERDVLRRINLVSDDYYFSQEIKLETFKNKQIKAAEIPIHFNFSRRAGKSKLNLIKNGVGGLAYFFKRRFAKLIRKWPAHNYESW